MPSPRQRRWLGALAAILVVAVLAFDSNWLKGPVERAVTAKLGRPFEIHGELDIVPRLPLRFVLTHVRLQNPPWAVEADTLRLERAEFSLAALPLLRGRLVLPEVALTRPRVDLERAPDGVTNNWTLKHQDARPDEPGAPPFIGRLTVDAGVLRFHDPARQTAITLEIATATGATGAPAVRFRAFGRYAGQRLDAEGTGGSMLSLADTALPYPIDATFRIGATHGALHGEVTGLAALAAADLALELRGETLSDLYRLIHVAIPPSPPYRVRGRLIRDDTHWRFHAFAGRVGDSDLSGDVDIAYAGNRTKVTARVRSDVLDLDDLGGFIGAPPQVGAGETASPRQQRAKAARDARPALLPDMPIRLERLRAMDADVEFVGRSIRGRTPLDNLTARFVLKDGVLTTQPLDFGVAGGNVVSSLVLDGRGATPAVSSNIEFRRIDLRRLFPGNATVRKSTGLVGGRAVLAGEGHSFAEVLGRADGTVGLAMSGGRVSNLVLELAGLDAAEALRLLFGGDRPVEVRCAVADLDVRDGVVISKSTIVDTTDTHIKIDGRLDLASEQLDLTLHPLPKDYSVLALRSPIHVRGTFKNPAVRPDDELLLRGGAAAALGAVFGPLAALVGLIETGPGDDADCEHLIAAIERHVGERVPAAAEERR